ncbi:unnamed protein product [Echinostoma caproni]|uniref:Uncharacterized protein n=1 Tax=Echinostoma caproni TaxID=27848 RepID=A0A183AFH8_9TREM|nr:unnamed protein product [Echinostoma caproni]
MGRSAKRETVNTDKRASIQPFDVVTNPFPRFRACHAALSKTRLRKRSSSADGPVQAKFANSAKDYLERPEPAIRCIYRNLLLKDNVIIQTAQTTNCVIEILLRQLALMGQEVDGALFDLESNTETAREIFGPKLAPAYENLVQLIRVILPAVTKCSLARHTFVQLLTHWMFVCRIHLRRSWLLCQPKRRGLFNAQRDVLPLYELLVRRTYLDFMLKFTHGELYEPVEDGLSDIRDIRDARLICLSEQPYFRNLGFQLRIRVIDTSTSAIRQVILSYCFLAPFCVYLNLRLRLRLTDLIINRMGLIQWYRAPMHKLQFEIYWTWNTIVLFEQRLHTLCQQIAKELAHWDMPFPLEYL